MIKYECMVFRAISQVKSGSSVPRVWIRFQSVDHSARGLHPWPTSSKPSPYEIFDIEDNGMSTLELNKKLKDTYVKYVKLYHPDTKISILDKGKEINASVKRARFDQVQQAYDILKDPRRRMAYKRYRNTKWDETETFGPEVRQAYSQANFEAFRKAQSHRKPYGFDKNEQFWQAGTWEDYYRLRYKRAPPTKEEIDKNKIKILVGVVAVGLLAFGLQFMLAVERMHEYQHQTRIMNMKALQEMAHDGGKLERVERFLTTRRSTMAVREEDPEVDDRQLIRNYAIKQVEKWDE